MPTYQLSEALRPEDVAVLGNPTPEDVVWLTQALADPQGKWFVVGYLCAAESIADSLFESILDAAIYEVNPSANRSFIEPCVRVFGNRRVNEYLLGVLDNGTNFEKAGAINALYWAQVPLTFPGGTWSFDYENATAESRAEYEQLADVWARKRSLLLRTFVFNTDVDVRRSAIASLSLLEADHEVGDRPLVRQAIAIARGHEDRYIRRRVEIQLGKFNSLEPLPHRRSDHPAS